MSACERLVFLFIFPIVLPDVLCALSCKSATGQDIDWFILYKVPTNKELSNGDKTDGTEFFYMDEGAKSFAYKNTDIRNANDNPLYKTLKPVYDRSPDIESYAMYNDQPPVGNAAQTFAHSKGAVAFNDTSGFWIVSSVPRFPAPVSEGYKYRDEQTKFGQTILCVTLKKAVEASIKEIFKTTQPYIFDEKNFNISTDAVENTSVVNIKSRGNLQLKSVAKSKSFERDLYQDLISPSIADSLLVETWRPNLGDNNNVKNVPQVCFDNGVTFYTGNDHSKWAVGANLPWTCIGDINREIKQFKRGGLSLCLNDADVAREFRKLVTCFNIGKNAPRDSCSNLGRKRAKISP